MKSQVRLKSLIPLQNYYKLWVTYTKTKPNPNYKKQLSGISFYYSVIMIMRLEINLQLQSGEQSDSPYLKPQY